MAAVQLQHVSKMFGSVTAVDDVSIEIMDHEFTSLLGPSGCGKTTCLRMIAGLEEPSTGEILIGGRDVNSIPPKDRDIAMVFQNYALYPHMSVRENMVMGLKFRKVPKEDISDRVGEAAKILELDELLDRRPAQLSGGQRQRVALGRAIVRNPQVFLMDEPLSNLDTQLRAQMRVELKSLHHRIKTTIIYVTHDQLEAMTMSDRIAVMNEGHVLQLDTPDRIFNEPINRFVAQFVGSPTMNFLPGILGEENGNPYVHMEDLTLPINGSCAEGLAKHLPGRDVEIGLRPHVVGLTPNAEEGLAVGEIFVVEPLGTHTHVHVKLGSQNLVAVADAGFTLGERESVGIRFQRQDVYLFDPASGKTLAHGI